MCSDSCLLWEHGRQPEVSSYFCLNSRSRWFKERTARGKSVIPLSLFTTYVACESGKLDRRSERQIVISGDNHSPPPGSTISMCHLLPTCFVCDFTEDISHAHWLTEPLIHTLINVSCQTWRFSCFWRCNHLLLCVCILSRSVTLHGIRTFDKVCKYTCYG